MKEDISVNEDITSDEDTSVEDISNETKEMNTINDILDNMDFDIDFDSLENIDTDDIHLNNLSIKELKNLCKELKLPVSGNKTKLIQRINEKKNIN